MELFQIREESASQSELVVLRGDTAFTTSLVIAEGTANEHRAVLQLIRNYKSDIADFGRVAFEMQPFETPGGVQQREVALLNEEQSTFLLTLMRNSEVVVAFKKRLVKAFFEMAKRLRAHQHRLPQNYKEALIELVAQVEENERLEAQIEADQPKVQLAEAVGNASNTIDVGSFAKLIGTGRDRLFAWLRGRGILMSNNVPYQRYVEAGWFKVIEQTHERPGGGTHVTLKTTITGKGQQGIHGLWRSSGQIPLALVDGVANRNSAERLAR